MKLVDGQVGYASYAVYSSLSQLQGLMQLPSSNLTRQWKTAHHDDSPAKLPESTWGCSSSCKILKVDNVTIVIGGPYPNSG